MKKAISNILKGCVVVSTIYTGVKFMQCRGTGKEDDRHLIGKAIDRMTGYPVQHDDVITIDDTDMHVSYNPYMQLLTNTLGCVATVLTGTTEVYTDTQFRNMSKDTQYAILCHEMGHYKHKHTASITYQFDRIKAIAKGQVLAAELEADAYATNIVGSDAMIKALREMATIKGVSKKEVALRIKAIRNS